MHPRPRIVRLFPVSLCLFLGLMVVPPVRAQTVVDTITRMGWQPTDVAVYETGNKVFIADKVSENLYIYDGTTLEELGSINVGNQVGLMVVDETHGKLYATIGVTLNGGKIIAVNAATNTLIGDVCTACTILFFLAHDPGLHKVYGASTTQLKQIDVATHTISSVTLDSASYAAGTLGLNPVTHEVFVGPTTFNVSLQIVDGNTLGKTTSAPVGSWHGMGINWTENKIYRADAGGGPYSYLDRDTSMTGSVTANNDALTFLFNPNSNRTYTSSEIDAFISIIEGSDAFLNIGMLGASTIGLRLSTNHIYYVSSRFIAIVDDATQMFEMIPISNPSPTPGGGSDGIAINQTTGRVFVINDGEALGAVTVLQDTPALTRPPVFAADKGFPAAVHRIDPVAKQVVVSWSETSAEAMAVRPGGGRLYVPRSSNTLAVYAGASDSATTMRLGSPSTGGTSPVAPAPTPDSSKVYVTNSGSNDVGVIDATNNTFSTTIGVGGMPWGAAVTPDGSRLYVANKLGDTVSVIDTASDTVVDTITVGDAPHGVAVNPSNTKVYVVNSGAGTVSVIDIGSGEVIDTVTVGSAPHWAAVTPDGKHLYVSNSGAATVSVVDTGTDMVIQTVPVTAIAEGVAALPNGTEVYVVSKSVASDSSLSVIDTSDFSVSSVTLPAGSTNTAGLAIADPTSCFAGRVTSALCPVENAQVRALQLVVEKGSAASNAAGDYSVFNLVPGTYDIEASATGFSTENVLAQSVGPGRTGVLHFALDPDTNPAPTLSMLEPASASVGDPGFNLMINGSDFAPNAVVRWNGGDRPTTLTACGKLMAAIPASDLETAGLAEVRVFNPAPGGGLSNPLNFNVEGTAAVPTLTGMHAPTSLPANASSFQLTVLGSDFIPEAVVRWNGSDRTTTFVSATELRATIPASDVETVGSAQITVFNPGGGLSNALPFNFSPTPNFQPTLAALAPASAVVGARALRLRVWGSGFAHGAVVRWNGAARPTQVLSPTEAVASIPARDLARPGRVEVTVANADSADSVSNSLTFTLRARAPAGRERGRSAPKKSQYGRAD